jgi:hypothetical protein
MIAIENGSTPSEATKIMPVVDGETLDAARITAIATPETWAGTTFRPTNSAAATATPATIPDGDPMVTEPMAVTSRPPTLLWSIDIVPLALTGRPQKDWTPFRNYIRPFVLQRKCELLLGDLFLGQSGGQQFWLGHQLDLSSAVFHALGCNPSRDWFTPLMNTWKLLVEGCGPGGAVGQVDELACIPWRTCAYLEGNLSDFPFY